MIYYAHSYQTLFLLSDRRLKIDVFIKDREEHFHSHHFIANCWQVLDGIRVLYQDIFLENTILQNLDPLLVLTRSVSMSSSCSGLIRAMEIFFSIFYKKSIVNLWSNNNICSPLTQAKQLEQLWLVP